MGHDSGRITAPVNTDDVSAVLGVGSHDVATLCTSVNKINKWARNKPETLAKPDSITDTERKEHNFSLIVDGADVFNNGTTFCAYIRELGLENKKNYRGIKYAMTTSYDGYKRLDDFVGYNHNAPSPFGSLPPQSLYLYSYQGFNLKIPLIGPSSNPQTAMEQGIIDISEFEDENLKLSEWFLGVALCPENDILNDPMMATMETCVKGDSNGIMHVWQVNFGHIAPSDVTKGRYYGFPFLASKAFTSISTIESGTKFIGFADYTTGIILTETADDVKGSVTGMYQSTSSTYATITASISNSTDDVKSCTSIQVFVATNGNGANSKLVKTYLNTNVGAKSTWTQTDTVNLGNTNYTHAQVGFYIGDVHILSAWIPFMLADSGNLPQGAV